MFYDVQIIKPLEENDFELYKWINLILWKMVARTRSDNKVDFMQVLKSLFLYIILDEYCRNVCVVSINIKTQVPGSSSSSNQVDRAVRAITAPVAGSDTVGSSCDSGWRATEWDECRWRWSPRRLAGGEMEERKWVTTPAGMMDTLQQLDHSIWYTTGKYWRLHCYKVNSVFLHNLLSVV